jgi:hypothetical protein
MRYTKLTSCLALIIPIAASSGEMQESGYKRISPWSSQVWQTRPARKDEPLREENITDSEVLQIEGVMRELYPGSIVYISGVTTGCACEDGPDCTDQVWSVASRENTSSDLALSRIDRDWQVGPLQEWWLTRDRIWDLYKDSRDRPNADRRISYQEYLRRIDEHNLAFPACDLESFAGGGGNDVENLSE